MILSLLSLLGSLQRERGYALRAIPAGSLEALAAFEMQSTLSSLAFEEAQKTEPGIVTFLPKRFFDAMSLRNNETFRSNLSVEALSDWYVSNLEQPIQNWALSQLTESTTMSPAQASAVTHNLISVAATCSVRDVGLTIYAKGEIASADAARLKAAASSFLARERLFLSLADEGLKRAMEEARRASLSSAIEIDGIMRKIKSGQGKSLLAETPMPLWFQKLDEDLAAHQDALRRVIALLLQEGGALAAFTAPGQSLDGDIEAALESIGALPLFSGLSEQTLRGLLRGARFIALEKGENFQTQGESISRFFVLIDGWAKLTKATDEGEESIVQILGRRECVLDNAFWGATLAAVSAKAVTKVRLLSLSLPVLRDFVTRNRELAQNLLLLTTTRLQKLVAQFEQITLRSAEQRVGWFFVTLHLESGLEGKPLELPYDKALIAAFLNIKPETFSRVLKKFRKQGFVIDKHKVILPHPQALCAYCDPEMALRCCRAEAVNCAPIRAARRAEKR